MLRFVLHLIYSKNMSRVILVIVLLFSLNTIAQEQYTISGYVQDNASGENLIGVSIYEKETYKGTASNQYGFYSLTMTEGDYVIIYSFIGYESITKNVTLNKDIRLNLDLYNSAIITEEVIVTGERLDKNVASSNMSQAKLDVKNIKQLPVIFGEIDVLKTAQLLPGIQSGGEVVGSDITALNFIGVGNTFKVTGTTMDISIEGGGSSGALVVDGGDYNSASSLAGAGTSINGGEFN